MEDRLLSLKWSNYKITFFENLKILREKSNYTDATLAVEGKFYPVHKVVMSTCSDYFRDIFERTQCKSPVIVLKDVRSHDIESLLDYMYLGEVSVKQNDLTSLLKTAESLRINGLAVPDENPTNICESLTSTNDDAGRDSPPPKRRRHDSKTIHQSASSPVPSQQKTANPLVNPAQTSSIPPYSTSNTNQNESPVVKVEMRDAEEQEERFRGENNYEGESISDQAPLGNYDVEPNTEQDESPVVKVEMRDAEEQEDRFRRENNYEGESTSDQNLLGNYGSDLSKTHHQPENYGYNSFSGPSLQQNDSFSMQGVMSKIMDVNHFKTNEHRSDSLINQNQTDNSNESVLFTSVKEDQVDKPEVSFKSITQDQLYKGSAKIGSANKQINNVLQSTTSDVPAIVVAAVNKKGSPVYMKIFGDQAIQMVKVMKPKQGKVGLIKVTHSGQIYTVRSNALRMTRNIPGIPDGISPNESTALQPGVTMSNIDVKTD